MARFQRTLADGRIGCFIRVGLGFNQLVTMARYQLETGFYGELYVYDYMCKNRPELAEQIRARNPHNRR